MKLRFFSYGPPKFGLFSGRPSELENGPSDVILGLSPPFQAYLTRFYYLVAFSGIRHMYSSDKKSSFSFHSHFYSTMSSSDVSFASSLSEDTDIDIDVADYDLEVEGSPNPSAKGSDQEAVEAYAGLLLISLDTQTV